jgi:hypothetical protein
VTVVCEGGWEAREPGWRELLAGNASWKRGAGAALADGQLNGGCHEENSGGDRDSVCSDSDDASSEDEVGDAHHRALASCTSSPFDPRSS